jgi:nucleoside-diphosphate-sugar epimerase
MDTGMHRQPCVLVTGATGMVGPAIVRRLASAGFRVRVLARSPMPPDQSAPEVDLRIGDVTDRAAVRAAVAGVDLVVHMAALLHVTTQTMAPSAYQRINVEGTQVIVDSALETNVSRLVLFSTIAVYGHGRGNVWDEHSPLRPGTPYATSKAQAEAVVLGARRADGAALGVVLRPAAVFGAALKGNYLRLVRALAARRFVPVGPGTNRRALVDERDLAEATLLASIRPEAAGRVYNVSDGHDYPLRQIVGAICDGLGRGRPRFYVPLGPVRIAVGAADGAARLLPNSRPALAAALDKYTEDVRVDSRRIQQELGFAPRHGLREGWADAIARMRQSGRV